MFHFLCMNMVSFYLFLFFFLSIMFYHEASLKIHSQYILLTLDFENQNFYVTRNVDVIHCEWIVKET
jgi:hypothetical protein